MKTIDITYFNLFIGLLLLLVPLYYLWKYKTNLVCITVVGTLRMIVQLLLMGIYMKYLFQLDNPLINILWVVIMVLIASHTAVARMKVKMSVLMIPISVGFFLSSMIVGIYFLGIVLELDNVFSARYFIPIAGILMGNMLTSNVVALNIFYSSIKREQQLYHYLLGNGATRDEAQAPFVKQAIIKSFNPMIANIAVMGLVALPGTMVGQILGGTSSHIAIKYQMMIMVITFVSSMISLMITIRLAQKKSFDSNGKLLPIERMRGKKL